MVSEKPRTQASQLPGPPRQTAERSVQKTILSDTATTFENLAKYLNRENVEESNLVYSAVSVIELIGSLYMYICVDRNSPIILPRSPGDQDVLSMLPEGAKVTGRKPTASQENLKRSLALDTKCDDDTLSAISSSVTGHRRRRNGSVVSGGSAAHADNWTSGMDPPTQYRGLGSGVRAVPQYEEPLTLREGGSVCGAGVTPLPMQQYDGPKGTLPIQPGETINPRRFPPSASRAFKEAVTEQGLRMTPRLSNNAGSGTSPQGPKAAGTLRPGFRASRLPPKEPPGPYDDDNDDYNGTSSRFVG